MPHPGPRTLVCSAALTIVSLAAVAAQAPSSAAPATAYRALLDQYCIGCHNARTLTANLDLESGKVDPGNVASRTEIWEKVLHKLDTGAMPPPGRPRPDAEVSRRFAGWLEGELDRAAARAPNPGRPTAHRLNRAEYTNAIRDLLALEIDARSLLP